MGNGESTFGGTCGVQEPGTKVEAVGHGSRAPRTTQEIDEWLMTVKRQVKTDVESIETRYNRYLQELTLNKAQLERVVSEMINEFEVGLRCHLVHPNSYVPSECSCKMLDSCVEGIPSGRESGVYYALDMGGTNFRVVRVDLKSGRIKESQMKASLASGGSSALPKGLLDQKATASSMFDFFAQTVKKFMIDEGDMTSNGKSALKCGFTFSFPCTMRNISSAALINWTKGFETGRGTNDPVEGVDVAELMNVAFRRNGVPMVINSVANDTVGTLLSCAYTLDNAAHPPCLVGLILGTGFNACYYEPKAKDFGYIGNIINIESGNFNRGLPRTSIDHAVDFNDQGGRGRQHLEKMVAGAYLGELCRQTIVKILQDRAPALSHQIGTLSSEDAATIVTDKSSSLVVVRRVIFENWQAEMDQDHLQMIQSICSAIFERAAALSACVIACCATKTGYLQEARGGLTVGVDGSIYKCNAFFREHIRNYLNILLDSQSSLVHLEFAEDGSGRGAGILAALVDATSVASSIPKSTAVMRRSSASLSSRGSSEIRVN